jgi:hypothetical protein
MSTLDISLMLLTILFWAGSVSYYFRAPILHWLDNRIPYEPLTGRLRALLRPGRR